MAFNPDQYLAQKDSETAQNMRLPPSVEENAGFNPDQYLVEKTSGSDQPGYAQTALEHSGNAMTLGYLPQLQAMAQKPIFGILNKLTGQNVEAEPYVKARDANIKRIAAEAEANPKTALASQVTGGIVGAMATPIPGLGVGGGLLKQAARGAAVGGMYGALQNPGDEEGHVDPLQLSERASGTLSGAVTGGVAGGTTGLVGNSLKALASAPQNLKETAEEQAVKASGGMLKDFRQLAGKDQVSALGRFARDKGIVQAGDTLDSIAEKASSLNEDSGKKLGQLYSAAQKGLEKAKTDTSSRWSEMSDKDAKQWLSLGFHPDRDKSTILALAKKEVGTEVGGKAAIQKLSNYLDDLSEKFGQKLKKEQFLDPKTSNDVKTSMDRAINYSRNPLSKEPDVESAFKIARDFVSKKVSDQIEFLSKYLDDSKAAQALKDTNRDYGFSKQILNMAQDKANRESANRIFGLSDHIAAGAGAAAGTTAGAMLAGDSRHAGEYGAASALAGLLGSKLSRKYGSAALSGAADVASSALKYPGLAARPVANAIGNNSTAIARGLLSAGLLNNSKRKKEGPLPDEMSVPITEGYGR